MTKGKYIVIEGPEGVGKTTQVEELGKRLQAAGLPVRIMREPDSQTDLTARAIRGLTQDPRFPMNTNTEVLLYNAARSQSLQVIKQSIEYGVYCIVDRNYLTTLAVQYYGRGDISDYQTINNIIAFAVNGTEPDLTIVLDAPVSVLKDRSDKRHSGERFDNLDVAFLERVRAGYLWEANQRNLPIVFADGSSEEVTDRIWQHVTKLLSIRTVKAETTNQIQSIGEIIKTEPPLAVNLVVDQIKREDLKTEDLITKEDNKHIITQKGKQYLSEIVTNTDSDVYGFYGQLAPPTIAAAMARLSRRADDMRITLLEEFAANEGKDNQLLQRVITAYGDDSVQQLAGMHFVIENASNLLTKKLEWGRLGAYLEQSTRYIYFDQRNQKGHYKYYTPAYLDTKTKRSYTSSLNKIFDNYSTMVHALTKYIKDHSKVAENERDSAFNAAVRAQACDAIRSVLPVATTATVGIYASAQAVESLISHLLSDSLPEADSVGRQLLIEARKIMPAFLERVDITERGVAAMGYRVFTYEQVKDLAVKYLKPTHTEYNQQTVKLDSYWPKNELDLVPDMLYEHSDLSLEELKNQVDEWTYDQKVEVFKTYVGERYNRRHRPGRALEKAHYSWDLLCDYGIFRDLQRHRMVDDLQWQKLTPRYGYEIPALVEEAGLSEIYEQCFDISLKLYSDMQLAGYENEAQYATLLGHRMRWKITYNAREAFHLHELRTSPQGHPGYRKLVKEMHDMLAEVHPLMAESMIFVNKDEDPELTRLAAERYTKLKLEKLDKRKQSKRDSDKSSKAPA